MQSKKQRCLVLAMMSRDALIECERSKRQFVNEHKHKHKHKHKQQIILLK